MVFHCYEGKKHLSWNEIEEYCEKLEGNNQIVITMEELEDKRKVYHVKIHDCKW